MAHNKAHTIVLGNEKGGCGKSTTAVHIVISLLKKGFKVAVIDLDARQKSLARYMENRAKYAIEHKLRLDIPEIYVVPKSKLKTVEEMEEDELERFHEAYDPLLDRVDYIIIDCPGSDTFLARVGHSLADTLVTPVNDSFVDLDLLANVNPDNYKVEKLSLYSEMVWEARKNRLMKDKGNIDWVILRNRTSALQARNKQRVHETLNQLQKRLSFRYITGLSERVIYRELFPKGLTLVDFKDTSGQKMSVSHLSARQEVRRLMTQLNLPKWQDETTAAAE